MQLARHLETALRSQKSREKARLILGAQQTGKSTLFQRILTPAALLLDLQERHPRHARRGFVVCRALRPEQLSRHLVAIPWDQM